MGFKMKGYSAFTKNGDDGKSFTKTKGQKGYRLYKRTLKKLDKDGNKITEYFWGNKQISEARYNELYQKQGD